MKLLHYEEYDTSAVVTGHLEKGGDTVFIEMVSILGHVRAIASAMLLLNHRKQDSGITLDNSNIHLDRTGHYRVFTHKAPERRASGITTKIIVVHDMFTALAGQADGPFYILLPGGYDLTQPPPRFFERLRQAVSIPLSSEWQDWLWCDALKHRCRGWELAKVAEGYGISMVTVHTNPAAWVQLVRKHLNLKCVLRPDNTSSLKSYSSADKAWQLVQVDNPNVWTIYHNGQRITEKVQNGQETKDVPLAMFRGSAIEYAEEKLGIPFVLEE